MSEQKKYIETVWHGRGGQGAITASQLIADSAYHEGFKGVTTAPSFGAERRGAPVMAFLRLAENPIRVFSQIDEPDIVVVLDPTLLPVIRLEEHLKEETTVIVNTTHSPEQIGLGKFKKVGTADITAIALQNSLTIAGSAILNTPILGAFSKTTGLVGLESIEAAIISRFGEKRGRLNVKAAEEAFKSTTIHNRSND